MTLLEFLLLFWWNNIQPNREHITLVSREHEMLYNLPPLFAFKQASLYCDMLTSSKSQVICHFDNGRVYTPYGVFQSHFWKNTAICVSMDGTQHCETMHLCASARLLMTNTMMSMVSTILLPRLLEGLGRTRKLFSLRMIFQIIAKLSIPKLTVDLLPHIGSNGLRTEINLVLSPQCMVTLNHPIPQNLQINRIVRDFLAENPDFPLTCYQIADLIYWAFRQQDILQRQDARMFGLDYLLMTNYWLGFIDTTIFRIINHHRLFGRALHLVVKKKNLADKLYITGSILESIIDKIFSHQL